MQRGPLCVGLHEVSGGGADRREGALSQPDVPARMPSIHELAPTSSSAREGERD